MPRPERSAEADLFGEASAQRLEQLERMQTLSDLLARCLTLESVCDVVLSDGLGVFDADAGVVVLRDGDELVLTRAVGYDAVLVNRFGRFAVADDVMLAQAVREQRTVLTATPADRDLVAPGLVGVDTGYRGTASLPLVVRGTAIGALGLSFRDAVPDSVAAGTLLNALAQQCALAVERARLYDRQREVAVTLQRSLLPDRLPALPGVTLDSAYVPGTAGTEVGGDWYDVIALPGGRVGLVIGDVMGRGVRAAAVMGQLRAVVRGYALEDHEPARLLSHLDRVVQTLEEMQLVTCIYAVYDPLTRELLLASAGHLPPLVVGEGEARFLDVEPGLPLGVGGGEYVESSMTLAPGSVVVLYTDGLVEARDVAIDEGMAQLRQAAGAHAAADGALCVKLLRALGRESDHDDDTALLAMRTSSDAVLPGQRAAHLQLVQATTSAAEARAFVITTLRAWQLTHLTETAVLLTSELVTNAIVHARSTVHVWMVADTQRLRVDVVDASARPVQPQPMVPPSAEGGRGLFLVETMSSEWGTESTSSGKRVWFALDC